MKSRRPPDLEILHVAYRGEPGREQLGDMPTDAAGAGRWIAGT